jgi:CRP/FNR family cyclic AMP-dependent transcriptional regulator
MKPKTREERIEFLGRVGVFEALRPAQLGELSDVGRSHICRARKEIFHKGDPGSDIYVVLSGRLKAFTTSSEGDDVVFEILAPGSVFGEVAMLAELPRTATVVAMEACELLCLGRAEILGFLRRHPDSAIELLRIVSRRLVHASEFLEDTLFLKLPNHLAKKLLDLSESYGEAGPDGIRINLKLSQTELGDLVGTTRESINKQLRIWRGQGVISIDAGHVVIQRHAVLEQLANAAD